MPTGFGYLVSLLVVQLFLILTGFIGVMAAAVTLILS